MWGTSSTERMMAAVSRKNIAMRYNNYKSRHASESEEVSEQGFMGFDAEIVLSVIGASQESRLHSHSLPVWK